MERNANYALVGAITLALFMGLVIFVVWLAKRTRPTRLHRLTAPGRYRCPSLNNGCGS